MDPQQELFSYLLVALKKEYKDMVFDGFMPPEETPYPFIYLADSQQIDDYGNKTMILGSVYQTIHIWNDSPKKRGTVSNIASKIKYIARTLEDTTNFKWKIKNITQRFLEDTTTKTPLMHVVLELEFEIIGGKK